MNREKMIDTEENIKTVGLENASIKAKKLLYLVINQCQVNSSNCYEYSVNASEFSEIMGIDASDVYQAADSITDELMYVFIKYIPEGQIKFRKIRLFRICEYTDDSMIKIQMNEEITPILSKLKMSCNRGMMELPG